MNCEYCDKPIDGTYGSGRFCDRKCACGFGTSKKRAEINAVVSAKLKGRKASHDAGFKRGHDPRRRKFGPEDRHKSILACKTKREQLYQSLTWDELPLAEKRRRIAQEQEHKCYTCKMETWMDKPILLELHHVDGVHENNVRENLQLLCPNCHSQTPNYRRKNKRLSRLIGKAG